MKADFHVHSAFSGDSNTPMVDMIQKAIFLGLDALCFTEHYDYLFPKELGADFSLDICSYYEAFSKLKKTFGSSISLHFGVELGMQKGLGEYYKSYVSRFPFDYVIASQHLLEKQDPYYPEYWTSRKTEDVIRMYFEEVLENLQEMECADALGHLDYIVRYIPQDNKDYNTADFSDLTDQILKFLIENGKSLEVNSAGLRHGLSCPNPKADLLKRYLELGGELITLGSDAHNPDQLALQFSTVRELLKSVGFTRFCTYSQHQPVFHEL